MKKCFCAFCRSPRKFYTQRTVGLFNVAAVLLGSLAFNFILFELFDPRGLFIFAVFLIVTEIFLKIRWRIAMTCRHCGFDPVLYLKSVDLAVDKVQRRLAARKGEASSLLARPLDLPKIIKKSEMTLRRESLALAIAANGNGTLVNRGFSRANQDRSSNRDYLK